MGDTGFDQSYISSWKTDNYASGNAQNNARSSQPANLTASDPLLERLLELWPLMSDADRQALVEHAEHCESGSVPGSTQMGNVGSSGKARVATTGIVD